MVEFTKSRTFTVYFTFVLQQKVKAQICTPRFCYLFINNYGTLVTTKKKKKCPKGCQQCFVYYKFHTWVQCMYISRVRRKKKKKLWIACTLINIGNSLVLKPPKISLLKRRYQSMNTNSYRSLAFQNIRLRLCHLEFLHEDFIFLFYQNKIHD